MRYANHGVPALPLLLYRSCGNIFLVTTIHVTLIVLTGKMKFLMGSTLLWTSSAFFLHTFKTWLVKWTNSLYLFDLFIIWYIVWNHLWTSHLFFTNEVNKHLPNYVYHEKFVRNHYIYKKIIFKALSVHLNSHTYLSYKQLQPEHKITNSMKPCKSYKTTGAPVVVIMFLSEFFFWDTEVHFLLIDDVVIPWA